MTECYEYIQKFLLFKFIAPLNAWQRRKMKTGETILVSIFLIGCAWLAVRWLAVFWKDITHYGDPDDGYKLSSATDVAPGAFAAITRSYTRTCYKVRGKFSHSKARVEKNHGGKSYGRIKVAQLSRA